MTPALPQPLRIFVVENHPDTLRYLSLFLEQLGHEVTSAQSLQQALQLLPESKCQVLISDIGLPDGSGYELMRQVGEQHKIYAVAMSGYGMYSDRARSKEAGFRHHLIKPFLPTDLEMMLAEASSELDEKR